MKQKFRKAFLVIFILACIGVIGYGGYAIYLNVTASSSSSGGADTPIVPSKVDNGDGRILMASIADKDFKMYFLDNFLVLTHDGQDTVFDWDGTYSPDSVQMSMGDYDGDSVEDIGVVIKKNYKQTMETTQELHILKINKNGSKTTFKDITFTGNSIKNSPEIPSDFDCVQSDNKKRVTYTIGDKPYSLKTPQNSDLSYKIFTSMSVGKSGFLFENGGIRLNCSLISSFAGLDGEYPVGAISAVLTHNEAWIFDSLTYTPQSENAGAVAVEGDVAPFTLTYTNGAMKLQSGKKVDFLNFDITNDNSENRIFSSDAQQAYLYSVIVTQSKITLCIKKPMAFDTFWLENGKTTLFMKEDGYYFHGTSEIIEDAEFYYLTTNFDEQIPQERIKTIQYHFGAVG